MLEFFALAQICAPDVHPKTIAAIVKTESRFRPFAIGVNYGKAQLPRQPRNQAEAVEAAKNLIAKGFNIDMGLGQINSANLSWLGLSVEDVFDPCKNLAAAARVLTSGFQRAIKTTGDPQQALTKALSAYNTGNFARGFSNGYVNKVVASNQALAAGNYAVPAIAVTAGQAAPAAPERRIDPTLVSGPQPAVKVQTAGKPQALAHGEAVKLEGTRTRSDPTRVFNSEADFDVESRNALVY